MLNKAEKRVRNMGKGELFKKWLSAIIALIFLFNTCSPAWARAGNYGDKTSFEMFANGMVAETSLAVSCFTAPYSAGFGSIASDLAGLTLYYTSYETYDKPWIKLGNMEISKSQVISTAVGIGASALGGFLGGKLDKAIDKKLGVTPELLSAPDLPKKFSFKDPKTWLKAVLNGPKADPYYRYGIGGKWDAGAAGWQLVGDLAIGFGKLLVHEFIKDNLVEGISIKTKKGKKLIETKPMDETEADIIASTGTYAFSLAFTPFVRGALGRLVYGKGNFEFDNQTGYLRTENAKYADPDVKYGVDKNNDGTVDCETETFSSQQIAVMLQNGEIKPDTKVIRYDKDGINTETTGAKLTPIFQDPYVVLAIGTLSLQTVTITGKDVTGKDGKHSATLSELSGFVKKEDGNYSLTINNETITVSADEFERIGSEVATQMQAIVDSDVWASPVYQSVLATTGGFLNDVHGNRIEPKLGAGLKNLQAAGLSPFVGAAVKVGMLRLMKYHTHYGTDDERIYENTLKMAAAEAAGNIIEAVVRNSNWLSAQYAGTVVRTVVRDSSGEKLYVEKLYVNPYAQRGHTGSLGEEYRRLVGKEIANQAFLFGSEWAWAAYCKQKGIQPDAADELMHLAAGSIVSGLVDAAFRRDPGKAKKEQVFIHDSEGDRFIDRDELTKSNGEFVIKGVDGEEKPVTIKAFADKDVVFIDGKGNVYLNPKTSDIENKFLVNVSLDKKNEPAQAGVPVSYDISIDVSSKLSDHFYGGKLHTAGYRNTETGGWIPNADYNNLSQQEQANYNKQTAIKAAGRFSRAVIEDFNNYFIQAATRSALYTSPQFTPGTGLGAFMAQQQNQESWIQYIAAVGQGASPILVAANRMAGNMRYFANANLAESFSASVTNPFIKDPGQRSYATFITTNERLKFIKHLTEQKKQQDERAIADMDAFEKYGKDKEGKIKKLDDELKSLKEEIEVLEWKKDDLRASEKFDSKISSRRTVNKIAGIVNAIDEKKGKRAKLEGAVRARDFLILQQLGVQGYIKVNKIYISRQEANEDILSLLPKVKAGLEAEVKSSETQIKVINQSAGVIGILGALPFIGAFPQAVFLSNVAVVTKGDSAFNDWIIGGIVDYNVSRAFETNAPMSEYMQGAMEKYINDNAQKLGLSEDAKKAFLEAMAKADQKTQMLQSTYFFSVAGVYQGSETYANVPLLTAGNITPELSLQLEQVSSTADTPLIVKSEIIKEARTPEKIIARLADIENELLTAEDKTKTALEKEKVDLRNIQAIQELRQKNPELKAFTWIPGDGEELKEKVIEAINELNRGRIVYSDYGLTERMTVDQFGRAVETQHFAPEFIDGKFQTARQDIVDKHYYGPFGHAVSKTVDYTQIQLPAADAWPVEFEKYKDALGDVWDKLVGEVKAAGVGEEDLAAKLGIIGEDEKNKEHTPQDLKNKFINFIQDELKNNPAAIDNINARIAGLAVDIESKNVSGDFTRYIPPVLEYSYKKDSAGNYITDKNDHRIVDKVIVDKGSDEYKQSQEASKTLSKTLQEGRTISYVYDGKEYQLEAGRFTKDQALEMINRLSPEQVKEIKLRCSEIWHKPIEEIDLNTVWGVTVAYFVLNPQADGKAWGDLTPQQQKDVIQGAIGWRLSAFLNYENDGVKQTLPNNESTRVFELGSLEDNIDFNKVSTFYLPVIAGQKMAAPTTVMPGTEYQPFSVGPNYSYDISLYSTQGGNSAYAGPTGRASLSDINSGPLLKPYTQYTVPSVELQLEKLIHDYAESNDHAKLVEFLTKKLGMKEEKALQEVNGLTVEKFEEEKRLSSDNFAGWAISRLGGQKEIVDAVANKQSELETALSRDLYNVKQFQFYRYENIGNREIPLPTWGGSTGYGLIQPEAGQPGNLGDNHFRQELRFDKGIIYTYDKIMGLIVNKWVEAVAAGNTELEQKLAGTIPYSVSRDMSLVKEPNNKDILGATYEQTTRLFGEGGGEVDLSNKVGSTNVISRSMLDEDAITKKIKKAERKVERKRENAMKADLNRLESKPEPVTPAPKDLKRDAAIHEALTFSYNSGEFPPDGPIPPLLKRQVIESTKLTATEELLNMSNKTRETFLINDFRKKLDASGKIKRDPSGKMIFDKKSGSISYIDPSTLIATGNIIIGEAKDGIFISDVSGSGKREALINTLGVIVLKSGSKEQQAEAWGLLNGTAFHIFMSGKDEEKKALASTFRRIVKESNSGETRITQAVANLINNSSAILKTSGASDLIGALGEVIDSKKSTKAQIQAEDWLLEHGQDIFNTGTPKVGATLIFALKAVVRGDARVIPGTTPGTHFNTFEIVDKAKDLLMKNADKILNASGAGDDKIAMVQVSVGGELGERGLDVLLAHSQDIFDTGTPKLIEALYNALTEGAKAQWATKVQANKASGFLSKNSEAISRSVSSAKNDLANTAVFASARNLGITNLDRFRDIEVLIKVIEARTNPTPDDLPLAVLIFASSDDDARAFAGITGEKIAELQKAGYRVKYYEISDKFGIAKSLSDACGEYGKVKQADLIMFGAHGTHGYSMQLGYQSDQELNIRDAGLLKDQKIDSYLTQGGNVVMWSCSAGQRGDTQGKAAVNLVNMFREIFPQAKTQGIFGPTQDFGPKGLKFDIIKGPVFNIEVEYGVPVYRVNINIFQEFNKKLNELNILPTWTTTGSSLIAANNSNSNYNQSHISSTVLEQNRIFSPNNI